MRRAALAIFLLLPALLSAQDSPQSHRGWPGYDDISDLKACFVNPPKGYGNVPFYWWTGDPLEMERLQSQLDILAGSPTDGLCVSYNHTHDKVDVELNAMGHGPCGRVSGGEPRVMSDEWWKLWNEFSSRCADKGIGLGMDDYVLAWPGNGEFMDSVILSPKIRDYQGRLVRMTLPASAERPQNAVALTSEAPDSTTYICTEASPWLHPSIGSEVVRNYFGRFWDSMDDKGRRAMNYFFQDELQYDLRLTSWCEDMPEQFMSRKGYDIVPLLPLLFIEDSDMVDARAAKVRLDYAEVLTQLSEERFFRPIFEWNAEKGLIYGCDNEGRGMRPLQYLDYFRACSWFTAPGNDAPSRGSSFRQTKVSSSIAHLYGRPRTWLEAFHSIGWDANGALLKNQLDHHLIAGGNLLCMHGLYYSTHGGWWEWAPPCFHFRMPYWEHMKLWLKYAERMCFLLSQGTHVCDVAVLYPTETMQAIPGTTAKSTFALSENLSTHGIDYDFIDYQSLGKAVAADGRLSVAGESYRVLMLSDTRAVHEETLAAILGFKNAGGIVIASGCVMPELRDAGVVTIEGPEEAASCVRSLIEGDFRTGSGGGRVLHRRIDGRDVYMVMEVSRGDSMCFRAHGVAERWDAMDGSTSPLQVLSTGPEGSWVRYDGEDGAAMLVVFSPSAETEESVGPAPGPAAAAISERRITGEWDVTPLPTMDNTWGDFRLPKGGTIGVEARLMLFSVAGADTSAFHGYGPHFLACNGDASMDIDSFIEVSMKGGDWKPYMFSWQYGVMDNPGGQGWHGLKSKVDPRFLILDKGGHQLFRSWLYVPSTGMYRAGVVGVGPDRMLLDSRPFEAGVMRLKAGWHSLLLAYADTKEEPFVLSGKRGSFTDKRDRSMVVFYPEDAPEPADRGMYDDIVASRWYGTDHLEYDVLRGRSQTICFETAPGTAVMDFTVCGKVRAVKVDGRPVGFARSGDEVHVELQEVKPGVSTVSVVCRPEPGYPGAAFLTGPVKMECRGGKMTEGDWTASGALGFYSGGMVYAMDVDIHGGGDGGHGRIVLDLGEVDATCEVSVNGRKAGALISSPYSVDITELVSPGVNRIEVTVYSTLSNHYRTAPSPYRGTPRAGLIGPVRLLFL